MYKVKSFKAHKIFGVRGGLHIWTLRPTKTERRPGPNLIELLGAYLGA